MLADDQPLEGDDASHCFDWDGRDGSGNFRHQAGIASSSPSGMRTGWRPRVSGSTSGPAGRPHERDARGRGGHRGRGRWAWPCSPATGECGRPGCSSLGLALALMAGEGWDELASIRDTPAAFAAAIAAAEVALAAAAILLRWPLLLPLLVVAALPFRVPIGVGGGEDVNLLVPLYVVLGGGALAEGIAALRSEEASPARCPRPLALALLAAVGLYAVQASYSNDIGFAARNTGFFLIPFAVMFALLVEVRWTRGCSPSPSPSSSARRSSSPWWGSASTSPERSSGTTLWRCRTTSTSTSGSTRSSGTRTSGSATWRGDCDLARRPRLARDQRRARARGCDRRDLRGALRRFHDRASSPCSSGSLCWRPPLEPPVDRDRRSRGRRRCRRRTAGDRGRKRLRRVGGNQDRGAPP